MAANNQAPLDYPERTIEYREGQTACLWDKSRDACPYGRCQLFERSLWLAGWHDMDMQEAA